MPSFLHFPWRVGAEDPRVKMPVENRKRISAWGGIDIIGCPISNSQPRRRGAPKPQLLWCPEILSTALTTSSSNYLNYQDASLFLLELVLLFFDHKFSKLPHEGGKVVLSRFPTFSLTFHKELSSTIPISDWSNITPVSDWIGISMKG